jgi:hypothetical protein
MHKVLEQEVLKITEVCMCFLLICRRVKEFKIKPMEGLEGKAIEAAFRLSCVQNRCILKQYVTNRRRKCAATLFNSNSEELSSMTRFFMNTING